VCLQTPKNAKILTPLDSIYCENFGKFSGPAKARAPKKTTTHNTKTNDERRKTMQGRAGRGKKLLH